MTGKCPISYLFPHVIDWRHTHTRTHTSYTHIHNNIPNEIEKFIHFYDDDTTENSHVLTVMMRILTVYWWCWCCGLWGCTFRNINAVFVTGYFQAGYVFEFHSHVCNTTTSSCVRTHQTRFIYIWNVSPNAIRNLGKITNWFHSLKETNLFSSTIFE